MTDLPRRTLVSLMALVPILALVTLAVVLRSGLSWYSGLALFYLALATSQFGYLGLLVLGERWRERMPAETLPRRT
jgi:threonine/homoserine efflux transporter RhtA